MNTKAAMAVLMTAFGAPLVWAAPADSGVYAFTCAAVDGSPLNPWQLTLSSAASPAATAKMELDQADRNGSGETVFQGTLDPTYHARGSKYNADKTRFTGFDDLDADAVVELLVQKKMLQGQDGFVRVQYRGEDFESDSYACRINRS